MNKFILLIAIASLSLNSIAQVEKQETTTTYFFIRHAEKASDGSKNPHLSEEGEKRAAKWAQILREHDIDAVYSTDYFRTKETAKPLAAAKQLEVTLYDPRAFDLQKFANDTKGKSVVVVGHSNTTPMYVNTFLGTAKYGQIQEHEYGNLYIVTIKNGKTDVIMLCL